MRVLLVEDDDMLSESLSRGLRAEGYAVEVAGNGVDGLHQALEFAYDLVILDILLPGLNGYEVCHRLRAQGVTTPILMLTAKDGEWDQADGLDGGADDYLVKPFRYPVLLARIRAVLRRGPSHTPPVVRHGDLTLDPATHVCRLAGARIDLTPKEFAILRYLLSRRGVVVSKEELLDHVWGDLDIDRHNLVEVHVSALRRKIRRPDAEDAIRTVRGVGYLVGDDGAA